MIDSAVTVMVPNEKIDETKFMKKKYLIISTVLLVALYIAGCSKVNENLPTQSQQRKVHADGIIDTASPNFHGTLLKNSPNGIKDCKTCHSDSLNGGITGISCSNNYCHKGGETELHLTGVSDPTSPNFHGKYKFMSAANWNITNCQKCHGTDYSGGLVNKSCMNCHGKNNVPEPEACNNCHGSLTDPSRIGPPRGLNGDTANTSAGVGAHYAHLYRAVDEGSDSPIGCSDCHSYPSGFSDPNHIDGVAGAKIIFGDLSQTQTGSITPNPVFNRTLLTCANTYCHGNFNGGNTTTVAKWNVPSSGACGTCHGKGNGNPVPTDATHEGINPEDCANACHSNIIESTKSGSTYIFKFKDKSLHVNGSVDF